VNSSDMETLSIKFWISLSDKERRSRQYMNHISHLGFGASFPFDIRMFVISEQWSALSNSWPSIRTSPRVSGSDRDAWYRAKVDVMWRLGPVAGIIDWKTGKVVEDSVQLMLAAAAAFAHYPELQVIRSTFAWLKEDATTDADIKREELPALWSSLWDRIELLRHAHETMSYPPTPNRKLVSCEAMPTQWRSTWLGSERYR
jgi:hypothetical protein